MDPFRRLPVELMFQILEDMDDYVGVESLISVSRPARAAFHMDSYAIVDAIITSNPITTQPDVKRLVHNIVILHTPAVTEEDEASQRFKWQQIGSRVLHIAAQIQRLACACLAKLRREFASAVGLEPLHAQRANEPFSWIEEYRMYWALWHLRSFSDYTKYVGKHRSSLYDSGDPPPKLIQDVDIDPTSHGVHVFLKEIIWTAAVTLEDLKTCPMTRSPGVLKPEHRNTLSWDMDTDVPFFRSFELPRSVETQYSIWSPPPIPTASVMTSHWRLRPKHCKDPSPQTNLFRSLRFQVSRRGPNRRGMDDILRYRRCGVLLWDKWRMFSTGLHPNNFRERVPTPDGGFIDQDPKDPLGPSCVDKWLEVGDAKQWLA
ncbi:unnamed protein product [Penicillium salamii]|uniref:F-box domain-containing protein n=1 Tax=Penicillium salamii TaxID=1612424 RepID=A0A9W4N435_9EURO|nr:unnamed protein product [Penicillium salamii]CAG8170084.1 unnamed protein product [Penicillium salamii]CAG8200624.1 unnamed protein product [Penicillium salamii]CAG8215040.1 unnamed protein product [Penicillium salamii]CAG8232009.1 unnamed protein product [Penicillium salamii]